METNELKNIWNTLAEKNLIEKRIAKENIQQIITRKGYGLFAKMKKKIQTDYWIYLAGSIVVPLITTAVHLNLMHPLPTLQAYFGIAFVELYLVYMFIIARRKLLFAEGSYTTPSIRESLHINLERIENSVKSEFRTGMIFGIGLIIFTSIQLVITGGGLQAFALSKFSSMAVILLIILLFIFPLILKYEFKIRFAGVIENIKQTIDELDEANEA